MKCLCWHRRLSPESLVLHKCFHRPHEWWWVVSISKEPCQWQVNGLGEHHHRWKLCAYELMKDVLLNKCYLVIWAVPECFWSFPGKFLIAFFKDHRIQESNQLNWLIEWQQWVEAGATILERSASSANRTARDNWNHRRGRRVEEDYTKFRVCICNSLWTITTQSTQRMLNCVLHRVVM